jgi:hypothetical protein
VLGGKFVEFGKLFCAEAIVFKRLNFASRHKAIYRLLRAFKGAIFFSLNVALAQRIQRVGAERGVCKVDEVETTPFIWMRLASGAQVTFQIVQAMNAML